MSYAKLDDEDGPGYFLPVEGQVRLARLSDHVRFLARLLAPRTQAEEDAAGRGVRMGEVAFCLELLADQVGQVLEALSWPAQRPWDAADVPHPVSLVMKRRMREALPSASRWRRSTGSTCWSRLPRRMPR